MGKCWWEHQSSHDFDFRAVYLVERPALRWTTGGVDGMLSIGQSTGNDYLSIGYEDVQPGHSDMVWFSYQEISNNMIWNGVKGYALLPIRLWTTDRCNPNEDGLLQAV